MIKYEVEQYSEFSGEDEWAEIDKFEALREKAERAKALRKKEANRILIQSGLNNQIKEKELRKKVLAERDRSFYLGLKDHIK
jgi:hypothetical protein